MANLHCRISTDATVGTTIGTFDPIDTRNANNILEAFARVVLGLMYGGAAANQTTATAVSGRLRARSAGAGVGAGEADFFTGSSHGAGIGTNSDAWYHPARFIPYEPVTSFPLGNTTWNLDFSQMGIEPADNWSVVAGVLHGAGIPPLWDWNVTGGLRPNGSASSNGAGVSATTATTLVASTILSKFRKIVSFTPLYAVDPVGTADEEGVGFAALDTSTTTVSGIGPLELPMAAKGPMIGTPVGTGVTGEQDPLPIYTEIPGTADRTLDVVLNLTTALTAADAFGYSVGLRL